MVGQSITGDKLDFTKGATSGFINIKSCRKEDEETGTHSGGFFLNSNNMTFSNGGLPSPKNIPNT